MMQSRNPKIEKSKNREIELTKWFFRFFVFSFFCIFVSLFLVSPVFAQQTVPQDKYGQEQAAKGILQAGLSGDCYSSGDCGFCDAVSLIDAGIKWVLGITGSLALLAFIYGGFNIMMSKSGIEYFSKGKKIITSALIGLVLIFGSYTMVNFILNILLAQDISETAVLFKTETNNNPFSSKWANICEGAPAPGSTPGELVGPPAPTPGTPAETPAATKEEKAAATAEVVKAANCLAEDPICNLREGLSANGRQLIVTDDILNEAIILIHLGYDSGGDNITSSSPMPVIPLIGIMRILISLDERRFLRFADENDDIGTSETFPMVTITLVNEGGGSEYIELGQTKCFKDNLRCY